MSKLGTDGILTIIIGVLFVIGGLVAMAACIYILAIVLSALLNG